MFTLHRYANAAIINQGCVLFLLFIPAECVNNATRAWTFICAVSSSEFYAADNICWPVGAVWSNQRRAALIAWPQQEARWSGMGHYLPGERSAPSSSHCPSAPPLFPFTSCLSRAPGSWKFSLSRCKRKSPWANGLLTAQAVMQLSTSTLLLKWYFDKTVLDRGHLCDKMRAAAPGCKHRLCRCCLEGQELVWLMTYTFIKLTPSQYHTVRLEHVAFDHHESLCRNKSVSISICQGHLWHGLSAPH